MSDLARREENGRLGEALTEAVLLKRFWVLDRSADVDGGDFLVQKRHDSLQELRQSTKKIDSLGIVQSKFFEGRNRVEIKSHYVIDDNEPREDFFCFIFTEDEDGEDVCYFFTAHDIVNNLDLSERGGVYYFAILDSRKYESFKGLKKKLILDSIENGMLRVEVSRNKEFLKQASFVFGNATKHFEEKPSFEYHLQVYNNVPVVICKNLSTHHDHLLEVRRDLFHCHSEYAWGNYSSSVKLLAISILTHHMDGMPPPEQAVFSLIENKLALLNSNDEHILTSEQIQSCILEQLNYLDTIPRKEDKFLKPISQNAEYFVVLGRDHNEVKFQNKASKIVKLDFPDGHPILSNIDRLLPISRQSIDIIGTKLLYPFILETNPDGEVVYHDQIQVIFYDN